VTRSVAHSGAQCNPRLINYITQRYQWSYKAVASWNHCSRCKKSTAYFYSGVQPQVSNFQRTTKLRFRSTGSLRFRSTLGENLHLIKMVVYRFPRFQAMLVHFNSLNSANCRTHQVHSLSVLLVLSFAWSDLKLSEESFATYSCAVLATVHGATTKLQPQAGHETLFARKLGVPCLAFPQFYAPEIGIST
jgi:hypothetical protein